MKYLTPEELKKNKKLFLDAYAEEGNYEIHENGLTTNLVIKYAKPDKSAILDCGVGSGFFLKKLHEAGYRNLYGVDIDDYRQHADERSNMLKSFAVLDVCFDKLPWPDKFFEAATAWEVMEHLENPHHLVREVERVVKPGGYFFISMPNVLHLFSRLIFLKNGEFPHWSEDNNHIAVYTPAIFKKVFRNFKVVETDFYGGEFPYRFFNKFKFFPANRWFGHTAWWVLQKKDG